MRKIKSLSDKELLNRLSGLVKQEHEKTLEILLHIIEVENRKIYRGLGYSSMFVYCTNGLGYSESSANRRIFAARAIRKCPEAYDDLRKGRVNLATLALTWKHLAPGLLQEIRDKSYRQVQTIVSRFNPMIKLRDVTRPVMVRKLAAVSARREIAGATPKRSSDFSLAIDSSQPKLGEISLRRGGKKSVTNSRMDYGGLSMTNSRMDYGGLSMSVEKSTPPSTETVKMHHVKCLVDDAVMSKLDRCKELLSGKYPCGIDLNTLLSELADTWLEKNDPIKRDKRRKKSAKSSKNNHVKKSNEPSRHISTKTRDAVYKRDGGRCVYIGANGKRCGSRWDLEIHHDGVPFARGGSHAIGNLKLLCAAHNKLESERVYGEGHAGKFDRRIE